MMIVVGATQITSVLLSLLNATFGCLKVCNE